MEGNVYKYVRECFSARKRVLFNRQRVLFGLAKRSLHHGRVIFNLGESGLSMVEGALQHEKRESFYFVECSLLWKKMLKNMAESALQHGRNAFKY